MSNEEIFALMDRFERSSCTSLKVTMKDGSIELSKAASAGASAPVPSPAAERREEPAGNRPAVTAPLVGTYYAAPAPDQSPFVQVGDRVSKGQTLCLLEAMKMMSEVPAPCDLVVEELLCQDGQLVSFGEPILLYRAV
ncbi:MAG: acetyl-CoA carboxylase biotin carboxyl carrier protein subunit [Clostridiales bacterium]|nr:acetyl-CoA carboxylase biotin carboxyl carrier protein subunit [Clostridiales bacterium]